MLDVGVFCIVSAHVIYIVIFIYIWIYISDWCHIVMHCQSWKMRGFLSTAAVCHGPPVISAPFYSFSGFCIACPPPQPPFPLHSRPCITFVSPALFPLLFPFLCSPPACFSPPLLLCISFISPPLFSVFFPAHQLLSCSSCILTSFPLPVLLRLSSPAPLPLLSLVLV